MTGTFGVRGELKVEPTRIGAGALAAGLFVTVEGIAASGSFRIAAIRMHKGRPLVKLDAIDDADAAQPLVGGRLLVARSDVTLDDGEYLDDDLVGCTLVDEQGTPIGDVVAVEHYPASDMLVVGARRAMIPLVRDFIKTIDVEQRRIVAALPSGLLDESLAESDLS